MSVLGSHLLDFIRLDEPKTREVIEAKLNEDDDEYGFIGEYYTVKCIVDISDNLEYNGVTYPGFYTPVEKTCLVDVQEFCKWLRKKEAVRWIS